MADIGRNRRRLVLLMVLVGLLLLTAAPAFSQGCSLCYTQAASSGARMIQALKSGILVLIVPPTLGSIGMLFVVHRRRNQVRRTDLSDEFGRDWSESNNHESDKDESGTNNTDANNRKDW